MNRIQKYITSSMLVAMLVGVIACGGNKQANEEKAETTADTAATMQADTVKAPEAKLNINTASEEAFRTIPGVGDKMVHEFEEYRPYVSIKQFRKEIGKYVDEEQVAAYEQYIFVPVSANDSDAASLQQLPGVDAEKAEQLISGRPYDSQEAFLKKLAELISEEQLATAKTYLKSTDSE